MQVIQRATELTLQAHHPGPGSWLDKAMAAQTAGVPLAGSSSHDTAYVGPSMRC
jgi:hypothetical protein